MDVTEITSDPNFFTLSNTNQNLPEREVDNRIQEVTAFLKDPVQLKNHIKGGAEYDIKTGEGRIYGEIEIEFP